MSWIQKLFETYNNCQGMVGAEVSETEVPLLPICHTTQKAQIEIVIDELGNFRRARVIPKNEARTIIPCSEKSGGRTSGEAPHPLCDKLQYVAGDYKEYGGSKASYLPGFIIELEKWCCSVFSHSKANAVLNYVRKKQVIEDLIMHQVLIVGEDGKLRKDRGINAKSDVLSIFDVATVQEDAFVRWVVESSKDLESRVWRDRSLWEAWINYYTGTRQERALCYGTGREIAVADQHPAKIRNDADKAKLISSNDEAGFTYRGRFVTPIQAASVGYETTQKAHAALRWLVSRQGYRKGDLAIVAWATSGIDVPKPVDDPLALLGMDELPSDSNPSASTAQEIALRLKKKIAGYNQKLGDTTDIVVMALDSATTGRLAITYYQELTGSEFLLHITDWHESCSWLHEYGTVQTVDQQTGKTRMKPVWFIGAPAPIDIAEAVYGRNADDKVKQATVSRLLPCIVEGRPVPRDLVELAVHRAVNRMGMKDPKDREERAWKKALSVACSLYRKHNRKENYTMTLDLERKTRDYLYGRLLALAEGLEAWALAEAKEKRETNAARLMQRFAERPFTTWRTIELALGPYKARLGGKANYYQRMIDEVMGKFETGDFQLDKRLTGEFLLGYHCQREALRPHNSPEKQLDDSELLDE